MTYRTETPVSSSFFLQCDTSELNANISNLFSNKPQYSRAQQIVNQENLQHMQQADRQSQTQVVRVRLEQNALKLVEFTSSPALLLRRLVEPNGHGRKHLELEVRHGLEDDLERKDWGSAVDLDILRPEVPELVGEDYGLSGEMSGLSWVWGMTSIPYSSLLYRSRRASRG